MGEGGRGREREGERERVRERERERERQRERESNMCFGKVWRDGVVSMGCDIFPWHHGARCSLGDGVRSSQHQKILN